MSKPYHHGNLRAALLAAAQARLLEDPEAELSLRDLASSVGVSVNATYRHFASKEDLLMELAATGYDRLRTTMEAAIAASGSELPEERMRAAGEAYIGFAQRDPGLYRLMFGRSGRFEASQRFRLASEAAFAVVVVRVAAVRRASPESPEVTKAAVAAWSLVHGYVTLGLSGHLHALPEAERPTPRELVRLLDVAAR